MLLGVLARGVARCINERGVQAGGLLYRELAMAQMVIDGNGGAYDGGVVTSRHGDCATVLEVGERGTRVLYLERRRCSSYMNATWARSSLRSQWCG